MIAAISDWLRHLVILILLAVLVDLVLPSHSMQKYIRTVLGLLVVLSMLSPLRALVDAHWNMGSIEQELSGPLTGSGAMQVGLEQFRVDLAKTVRQEVTNAIGVNLQDVQVETALKMDGTPIVTGIAAAITHVGGSAKTQVTTTEVQAQIATLLGLPMNAIHITGA